MDAADLSPGGPGVVPMLVALAASMLGASFLFCYGFVGCRRRSLQRRTRNARVRASTLSSELDTKSTDGLSLDSDTTSDQAVFPTPRSMLYTCTQPLQWRIPCSYGSYLSLANFWVTELLEEERRLLCAQVVHECERLRRDVLDAAASGTDGTSTFSISLASGSPSEGLVPLVWRMRQGLGADAAASESQDLAWQGAVALMTPSLVKALCHAFAHSFTVPLPASTTAAHRKATEHQDAAEAMDETSGAVLYLRCAEHVLVPVCTGATLSVPHQIFAACRSMPLPGSTESMGAENSPQQDTAVASVLLEDLFTFNPLVRAICLAVLDSLFLRLELKRNPVLWREGDFAHGIRPRSAHTFDQCWWNPVFGWRAWGDVQQAFKGVYAVDVAADDAASLKALTQARARAPSRETTTLPLAVPDWAAQAEAVRDWSDTLFA